VPWVCGRTVGEKNGWEDESTTTRFIHGDGFRSDLSRLDGSEVVVTPTPVLCWRPPKPFGQWTESPFQIDGMGCRCAEQYVMAKNARLRAPAG